MNKGEPILRLLAPARANAAPFEEPGKGAFDHPAPRRVLHVRRHWGGQGLIPPPAVLDMGHIAGSAHHCEHIGRIVAFVGTQMLALTGPGHHHPDDQVRDRPFVMPMGFRELDRQWGPTCIHEQMDLAAALAPVGGIAPRLRPAQRGSAHGAIDGLPRPRDVALAGIDAYQCPQDLLPDALLLPGLKPFMEDTARDAEPGTMDGFPLTAGPEHVPDAVKDLTRRHGWAARSTTWAWCREPALDEPPQGARHMKIVNSGRFWRVAKIKKGCYN